MMRPSLPMVPVFKRFKVFVAGLVSGVMVLASGSAFGLDLKAWEGSTNPETKERYIPVELWAGAEWDGKRELKMPNVDGTYKHPHAQYQIKGPVEYKHPVTGQTFLVYERINPGKNGAKWQLFTINQDQTGLGRLYDGRPGRDARLSSGGLKFPLRVWRQGETKRLVYKVYQDSQESERAESVTIKQIDFSFQGSSHCLEFYWTATDRHGKKTYDRQTYIYCPGKSMVSQIQH